MSKKWWRWPICLLRWCPCRHYEDEGGCGGQCIHCGKVVGYVTRDVLRAYADRVAPPHDRVRPGRTDV